MKIDKIIKIDIKVNMKLGKGPVEIEGKGEQ